MTEKFPDISEVDVTNGEDVKGFGKLIISLLHEKGRIVIGGTPSARQKKLIAIAELWLDMVKKNVARLGVEHRTLLMDRYDILYRYVYHSMPDMAFVNSQRYSVVDGIVGGNKDIDLAETLWMITFALQHSKSFDFLGRAKKLHDSTLNAWVKEFESTSNFFDMSKDKAVRRALTLIREDVKPHIENTEVFKQAVAARISLLFNDFLSKDLKTLESMLIYLAFAQGKYVDKEIAKSQTKEILSLLSVMPQLNRFDRLAYANDLKRETYI